MRGSTGSVAQLGEDRLVARIRTLLGAPPPGVLGAGDDAALAATPGATLLLTTDVLLEGSHFRNGWFTASELGHKILAVNLSDAAAMGGVGTLALVSLILPSETPVRGVEAFYRGMLRLARRHGVAVVGGNLARGEAFSVTLTLVGSFPGGNPILRSGARPGDRLYVTGQPGLARLGLALLAAKEPRRARPASALALLAAPPWRTRVARGGPWRAKALARFLTPTPRLREGRELARLGARALMDLSDGPGADLPRLAAAAGVAFVIDPARLPLPRGFCELAVAVGESPIDALLRGGEDYELVAALPPEVAVRLGRRARLVTTPITEIGTVVEGRGVFVLGPGGPRPLIEEGFDHFRAGKESSPRVRPEGKARSRR